MTGHSMDPSSDPTHPQAGEGLEEDVEVNYKQFLMQKEVLDTLRLYLDPNETTINRLLRAGVLSMPQRDELMALKWPMNRNGLLQILVRRQWEDDKFKAFLEVVKHTQNPRLNQTMKILLSKEKSKLAEEDDEPFEHPLKEIIKGAEGGSNSTNQKRKGITALDGPTKNMIQSIINQRDEEIARTRADLEASRAQIKDLETANGFLQGQMAHLERVVADVVSVIVTDGIYPNSEDGLNAVLKEVKKLWNREKADQTTITCLEEEKKRWTYANSLLTTQNIELKETRSTLQKRLAALEKKTSEEIAMLRKALKKEKESVVSLCNQLKETKKEKMVTEVQLSETTKKLQATERTLDEVRKSRDALITELKAVDYRVRRLLKSLGMPIDRRMLSQAIEHAGNMIIVRKRQGEHIDVTKLQLESEERASEAEDDEADGSSAHQEQESTAHSSLGVLPVANRRLSTQELSLGLPQMSMRRTSLLGLPRMTGVARTSLELTMPFRDAAVAAGRQVPSIQECLIPLSAVAKGDGAVEGHKERRDSEVVLPHIRRRSSLAWKLKTDISVGTSALPSGLEDASPDALVSARRRSVYLQSVPDVGHSLT